MMKFGCDVIFNDRSLFFTDSKVGLLRGKSSSLSVIEGDHASFRTGQLRDSFRELLIKLHGIDRANDGFRQSNEVLQVLTPGMFARHDPPVFEDSIMTTRFPLTRKITATVQEPAGCNKSGKHRVKPDVENLREAEEMDWNFSKR